MELLTLTTIPVNYGVDAQFTLTVNNTAGTTQWRVSDINWIRVNEHCSACVLPYPGNQVPTTDISHVPGTNDWTITLPR